MLAWEEALQEFPPDKRDDLHRQLYCIAKERGGLVRLLIWSAAQRAKMPGGDAAYRQALHDTMVLLTELVLEVERRTRIDELERIKSATLDWADDVWSTSNDGRIVSVPERLASLDWKPWYNVPDDRRAEKD